MSVCSEKDTINPSVCLFPDLCFRSVCVDNADGRIELCSWWNGHLPMTLRVVRVREAEAKRAARDAIM